jgi:hypothetical protein
MDSIDIGNEKQVKVNLWQILLVLGLHFQLMRQVEELMMVMQYEIVPMQM